MYNLNATMYSNKQKIYYLHHLSVKLLTFSLIITLFSWQSVNALIAFDDNSVEIERQNKRMVHERYAV